MSFRLVDAPYARIHALRKRVGTIRRKLMQKLSRFARQHVIIGIRDLVNQWRRCDWQAVKRRDRHDAERAVRHENSCRIPQMFRLDDALVRGEAERLADF